MVGRRLVGLVTAVTVIALIVAACGSSSDSSSSSSGGSTTGGSESTSSESLKDVTYLTGFGYAPWDAGIAVAQQKGYYEEAGLNVNIKAGQGSTSNLQLLGNGKATISGVAGASLAIGVQKGVPVKAVASFFQIAGSGVMTEPDIKSPKEMEGKSFAGSPYDFTTLLLPLFEKAEGISGINVVTVDPASLPGIFVQGRAEMMSALEWAEVPEVEAEGKEFNFFSYADAGLNLMGPTIATSVSTLETEPDMIKAFVEATAKGFAAAYKDPQEAAEIVYELWPTTQPKYNEAVVPTLGEFAHTEATEGDTLGWMSKADWEQTVKILVEGEQMSKTVPVSDLYENVLEEKE